jgi:glycosyltransferase involved in cell wall biosynthesis
VEFTKSGLIVKPNDVGGFAEAVVTLYKDRHLGAELGLRGRAHVSENLTAERIGERIHDVFAVATQR